MILIYLADITQFEIFNKKKFNKKKCLIFSTNLEVFYLCKKNNYRIQSLKYTDIENKLIKKPKKAVTFFIKPLMNCYEHNLINEIYRNLYTLIENIFIKTEISIIYLNRSKLSNLNFFNSDNELNPKGLDIFSQLFCNLILYEKSLSIGIEIKYF